MTRDELLLELSSENVIGIQLLEPFVPHVDVEAHLYTEIIQRNPNDPSANDADLSLHILTQRALIICKCSVAAIETVDVGGRVEVRRGAKDSSTRLLPLDRVRNVALTSTTGVYGGRTAEPDEPFTLAIGFEEDSEPVDLRLPDARTLENRPLQEVRAVHESVREFGKKLMALLSR